MLLFTVFLRDYKNLNMTFHIFKNYYGIETGVKRHHTSGLLQCENNSIDGVNTTSSSYLRSHHKRRYHYPISGPLVWVPCALPCSQDSRNVPTIRNMIYQKLYCSRDTTRALIGQESCIIREQMHR